MKISVFNIRGLGTFGCWVPSILEKICLKLAGSFIRPHDKLAVTSRQACHDLATSLSWPRNKLCPDSDLFWRNDKRRNMAKKNGHTKKHVRWDKVILGYGSGVMGAFGVALLTLENLTVLSKACSRSPGLYRMATLWMMKAPTSSSVATPLLWMLG